MNDVELEVALDIMQRKIVCFIKNNKEKDIKIFQKQLKQLLEEEDKIYELDEDTINKVFNVYLKELKELKK